MAEKITMGRRHADRARRADHPLHRGRRHGRRHLAGRASASSTLPWRAKHGKRDRVEGGAGRREGVQADGRLAARGDGGDVPRVPHRHQGTAHDAGRRRDPLAQRGAAPDPRPVRVPAPGPLVPGRALAREAPRAGRHGDLPGEHRGHLRRPRGRGGNAGGQRSSSSSSTTSSAGRSDRTRASASSRSRSPGRKRLVRAAIQYAVDHDRKSVTLVHKGNIQKFTEGAFRNWGYELARDEFADVARRAGTTAAASRASKILVKDNIADITLQQVLTRPDEFDVIATTNLNGDYLSDALAAQVGGIGIAPGGNINYVTGHGDLRGDARHRAEVRRPGQGEPGFGAALGRDDARAPRLAGGRRHRSRRRSRRPSPTRSSPTTSPARWRARHEVKTSEFASAIIDHM